MHIKIPNPSNHKNSFFDNKGSSLRNINYLSKEAKEKGIDSSFFSFNRDDISKEEVIKTLDNNVKGLKKDDDKFYNIFISPSDDELKHISGDKERLKEYTRDVMKRYARNFSLKKEIKPDDVVWFATVHSERKYKNFEKEVKRNNATAGEKKKGNNTHIHLIISARDKKMTHTLNPLTRKRNTFSRSNFYFDAHKGFTDKFNYKKTTDDFIKRTYYYYKKRNLSLINHINKNYSVNIDKNRFEKITSNIRNSLAINRALHSINDDFRRNGRSFDDIYKEIEDRSLRYIKTSRDGVFTLPEFNMKDRKEHIKKDSDIHKDIKSSLSSGISRIKRHWKDQALDDDLFLSKKDRKKKQQGLSL